MDTRPIFALFVTMMFLTPASHALPITGNQIITDDGPVNVDDGIKPDSFLYFFDLALDNLDLALTFDNNARAGKSVMKARERLLEFRDMVELDNLAAAEIAEIEHKNALKVAEDSIIALQEADPEQELEEVAELEQKIEQHKDEVENIVGEINIRIKTKGEVTVQQQQLIDSLLNNLGANVERVDISVKNKLGESRFNFKTKTGKSDEEIDDKIKKIEIRSKIKVRAEVYSTGVTEVKVKLEFDTMTMEKGAIIHEIIDKFALDTAMADALLKIETGSPDSSPEIEEEHEHETDEAHDHDDETDDKDEEEHEHETDEEHEHDDETKDENKIEAKGLSLKEGDEDEDNSGSGKDETKDDDKDEDKEDNSGSGKDETKDDDDDDKDDDDSTNDDGTVGDKVDLVNGDDDGPEAKFRVRIKVRSDKGKSEVRIERKGVISSSAREDIVAEAVHLSKVIAEEINAVLDFRIKDENSELDIDVDVNSDGVSTVQVDIGGEDFEFLFDSSDIQAIISEISDKTGIAPGEIQSAISVGDGKDTKDQLKQILEAEEDAMKKAAEALKEQQRAEEDKEKADEEDDK